MTKYIKTGTTEFEQFNGSDEMIGKYDIDPEQIGEGMPMYQLETLKETIQIFIGDWIATGVNGEHWPVEDEIFKKTYKKLPVIPKAVGEYIKRWKDDLLTEPLFVIFLTIQHNINIDNPPDLKSENWIIDNSDTFARAWLLGVWSVEETGEIVKLEEEK